MAETTFVEQARARVRSCQTDISLDLFNDILFVQISNEDLSSLGELICSRLSFLNHRIWSKVSLTAGVKGDLKFIGKCYLAYIIFWVFFS